MCSPIGVKIAHITSSCLGLRMTMAYFKDTFLQTCQSFCHENVLTPLACFAKDNYQLFLTSEKVLVNAKDE